jgi:hypothetical protein
MLDRPTFCVGVYDDLLVVTDPLTHFYAIFSKRPELPQVILQRSRRNKEQPLTVQARQAANEKARELGWFVEKMTSAEADAF